MAKKTMGAGTLLGIGLMVFAVIAIVLALSLVYTKANKRQLSMDLDGNLTEHGQGLGMKVPWASLLPNEINMQAEIIITSGGILTMSWEKFISEKVYEKITPRAYEADGEIPIYGSWATAIQPLKGHLTTFLSKTPQVAALMTMAEIDINISDYIAGKDPATGEKRKVADILSSKKTISKFIAGIFEGEDETSEHEKKYGIKILDPQLFDLNLGEKSKNAAEDLYTSRKSTEAIQGLMTADPKNPTKFAEALDAYLLITGRAAKKTVFELQGMEQVAGAVGNGIGGGLKALAEVLSKTFTKK